MLGKWVLKLFNYLGSLILRHIREVLLLLHHDWYSRIAINGTLCHLRLFCLIDLHRRLIPIRLFTFAVIFILFLLVIIFFCSLFILLLLLIRVALLLAHFLSLLHDLPLLTSFVLEYNRSIELRFIQQFLKSRRVFLIGRCFVEELAQSMDLMCRGFGHRALRGEDSDIGKELVQFWLKGFKIFLELRLLFQILVVYLLL